MQENTLILTSFHILLKSTTGLKVFIMNLKTEAVNFLRRISGGMMLISYARL